MTRQTATRPKANAVPNSAATKPKARGDRMRGAAVSSEMKLNAAARFCGTSRADKAKMHGTRSASPKPTAANEMTLKA